MGNLSHTVGGTDNLVSFKSAARVPIDSLKVHFSPIQEGEGDPSPENIRPIRGWNEIEAYRVPEAMPFKVIYKNSASYNVTFTCDNNGIITANGIPTSYATFMPIEVEVKGDEILYEKIFGNMQNVTITAPFLFDKNGNSIKASLSDSVLDKNYGLDLSKYPGVAKVRVGIKRNSNNIPMTGSCFIAITNGAIASASTIPVTFSAEVGTIYGGYVDLEKGEVVETIHKYKFSLSEFTKTEYDNRNAYVLSGSGLLQYKVVINKKQSSNIAKYQWESARNGAVPHFYAYSLESDISGIQLALPKGIDESIDFEFIAELETPIHYPLTSTQLNTFLNNNTFWSNTNDVTEVSYAIHDTASIRAAKKRIMAASPKLETASSDLVTFNTDVIAPLKECKVEFKPKQNLNRYDHPWVGGAGKNLLRVSADNRIGVMDNATETDTGFNIGNGNVNGGYLVKVKPNTIYTYSYTSTYNGSSMHGRIWEFAEKPDSSTGLSTGSLLINRTSWTGSATFTTDENTNWVVAGAYAYDKGHNSSLTNMQVEEGSVATSYEPYENICPIEGWNNIEVTNGTTISITFPTEAGTIYGGYVDLVNGEIVQEWELASTKWGDIKIGNPNSTTGYYYGYLPTINTPKIITAGNSYGIDIICNCIDRVIWEGTGYVPEHIYAPGAPNNRINIFGNFDDSQIIQVAFKIATPIHYPIDSQTLKTLRGVNNIWSTSNGPITIKYWKH